MAIAVGAAIVTRVVKAMPTWVRVVCVIAAAIALINAFSIESQLDENRQEINRIIQ